MKKYALLSPACTAACLSSFAAVDPVPHEARKTSPRDLNIVQIADLTENDLKEIAEGRHPDLVLEFPAGTRLSVRFLLNGDLIRLQESGERPAVLEIQKTLYARCTGSKWLVGGNVTELKPLLEFVTGTGSVTLLIQDGEPSSVFGLEINRRL